MKKVIGIIIFIILIFVSNLNVQAESLDLTVNYTEQFSEWLNLSEEEKQETSIPSIFSVKVSEDFFEKNSNENKKGFLNFIKKLFGIGNKYESKIAPGHGRRTFQHAVNA